MKIRIWTVILLSLTMTGCMLTVDSDISRTGANWDDDYVDQIRIGKTTRDWVLNSFGPPSSKVQESDGTEIWRYKNVSERDTEVSLFLLFHIDLERQHLQTLQIEIKDDVVVDFWIKNKWVE